VPRFIIFALSASTNSSSFRDEMFDPTEEVRVVIRVCVTDLPGNPLGRHTTLAELFSANVLHRPINQVVTAAGYDGVFIPPGFNSEKPVNKWFIYDLNVSGQKNRDELLKLPHKVYLASSHGGNWLFAHPYSKYLN
jgi:hypothetical protein